MTKEQLKKFAKDNKLNVKSSLSKSDFTYSLIVEAKKNLTIKSGVENIKTILNLMDINNESNDVNVLYKQMKSKKIDSELKEISITTQVPESNKVIIEVENLKIGFKDGTNRKSIIEIIRGVSFKVKKGEIVGFIGESGSGKSVTSKSLFGMNENSITFADKMLIDGIDMTENVKGRNRVVSKNSKWRKIRGKKVAYIPQNPMTSLNPTSKIYKQILETMELHDKYKEMSRTEMLKEAIDLLEEFGIKKAAQKINMFPHEFSGGMRQRVVIAMAVISTPDIIIADEPTTALDPTIQSSVLNLFKEIAIKYQVGIIFVSHDISVISTLCDYINVFYAGKIIERASKYELFTNPQHPYTWALISSMPELSNSNEKLYTLDGTPPNFKELPAGDPFSPRNKYAMQIDFKQEPPLFKVKNTKNHYAATWLLHPSSPKVKRPSQVDMIAANVKKDLKNEK